jgi:xanthine dehydrogenase accessory factor
MDELERVYEAALVAMRQGDFAAVATVIDTWGSGPRGVGTKMLVYADGRTVGTVGGGRVEARVIEEAVAAIRDGRPRDLDCSRDPATSDAASCSSGLRVFIEVLPSPRILVIVGAGHVGQAVAELGAFLGYRIMVVDERDELLTAERFPCAQTTVVGSPDEVLRELSLTAETFVVFVTPHQARDERVLAVLADSSVGYIGLMGGLRRTEATFERARALGVPEAFLASIRAPIGLSIGAETPREIAVSIVAEIVAVGHGHTVG